MLESLAASFILISVCILILYFRSGAYRARKQAQNAVLPYERLAADLQQQSELIKKAIAYSTQCYVSEIRTETLRKLPVEELRKHQSGLRLQALRSAGLNTVADLQGWSSSRLMQIRGIGESSARGIESAVKNIVYASSQAPTPHPAAPFPLARDLSVMQEIYRHRWFESRIPLGRVRLQENLKVFKDRLDSIRKATSLLQWLRGLASERNKAAITESEQFCGELEKDTESTKLLQTLRGSLEESRGLGFKGIQRDVLVKDIQENQAFYDLVLTQQLGSGGRNARVQSTRGGPQPVTRQVPLAPVASSQPESASIRWSASALSPAEAVKTRYVAAVTDPISLEIAAAGETPGRKIPPPPFPFQKTSTPASPNAVWIPAGKDVTVHGHRIPGGLVYFGTHLPTVAGLGVEPSLIDFSLPVAKEVDRNGCSMGYWPSYSLIGPEHRAAYLEWLASGKCDPYTQIGFVFLYFYGLERRALTLPLADSAGKDALEEVRVEIHRLLEIYGSHGSSFKPYASSLLEFLDVSTGKTFSMALEPTLRLAKRMNLELKASLGLFAATNQPLPSSWAQEWYLSRGPKRAMAAFQNCGRQFSDLFKLEYHSRHGEGLLLPSNRPRITATHHPASRTFGVSNFEFKLPMPDVTGLEAPLRSLEEIGDKCIDLLEGYRRFLRANPSKIRLEASISLLPPQIWPANTQSYLKQLKEEVVRSGKPRLIKISQVQGVCSYASTLDKNRIEALTAGFLFFGLGVETDVSLYDKLPSSEDHVAVYSTDGLEDNPTHPHAYLVAKLLLHLAAMVASKSKVFDDCESEVIRSFIESASGLSALGRARLMARLYLYKSIPPNTFGLKKQIDQLGTDARAGVGDFLVQVALADGSADPGEVRVLEDLFELLGLEKPGLYSKLHSLATQSHSVVETSFPAVPLSTPRLDSPAPHAFSDALPSVPTPLSNLVPTSVPVSATKYGSGPIRFDPARIAALKADSAKISALLAGVFVEEELVSVEQPVTADEPSEDDEPTLLGLDAELDSLLKFFISKSQWTRAEIETLCSDRGLMVDGTIERIHDAAFNQFNCPLIEGDDPIQISCELI